MPTIYRLNRVSYITQKFGDSVFVSIDKNTMLYSDISFLCEIRLRYLENCLATIRSLCVFLAYGLRVVRLFILRQLYNKTTGG